MIKPKINEFILVEGKSDTENIKRAVIADTIETGGSAINKNALVLAKQGARNRGLIILTDPDYNGQRIRQIVAREIPEAKHAYISQQDGRAHKDNPHKSLGVEHARPEVIQAALLAVMTPKNMITSDVDRSFLLDNGLLNSQESRKKRELIGEILHIGYTNGKQLFNRIHQFGITKSDILEALEKENNLWQK
ncbi:ribonuclease M5 [Leuconostoc palmae]|uniref:ribonuclease M5 n=1 Tax=Leuconostoc palmae TaxID=501487 RepID=UPI001C7D2C14|nr:ribonuclease M5 [Leuconostoc palmae]